MILERIDDHLIKFYITIFFQYQIYLNNTKMVNKGLISILNNLLRKYKI